MTLRTGDGYIIFENYVLIKAARMAYIDTDAEPERYTEYNASQTIIAGGYYRKQGLSLRDGYNDITGNGTPYRQFYWIVGKSTESYGLIDRTASANYSVSYPVRLSCRWAYISVLGTSFGK